MLDNNKERPFKYLRYTKGATLVGKEGYPQIEPTQSIPHDVISFGEWITVNNPEEYWIDHFIDDYRFERVYRNCDKYLQRYKKAKGVIGTDFSAYRDMPLWHRKESVGKNREIDYYLQKCGIDVIPVVSFAYMSDFDWCLDGMPHHSSVAISTNGSVKNFVSRSMFIDGVFELQRRLMPSHLIIAGNNMPELDEAFNNIYYYPNYSQRLNRKRRHNG